MTTKIYAKKSGEARWLESYAEPGSYVPEYTMDNNDIARLVETSDEWIRERTGVVKRHIIRG